MSELLHRDVVKTGFAFGWRFALVRHLATGHCTTGHPWVVEVGFLVVASFATQAEAEAHLDWLVGGR